jgi:hypothetical protein
MFGASLAHWSVVVVAELLAKHFEFESHTHASHDSRDEGVNLTLVFPVK